MATFAMHPDKASGMDRLNPSFFQAYWSIVAKDVCNFCQGFFETGDLPENMNTILACLIPKVKHPKKEQQSVFIENRLLTNNVLVAFEVNHHIHRNIQGAMWVVGLKVDVLKAYDMLEWTFIEYMHQKFDSPRLWIDRIMKCIKTVSFSPNTKVEDRAEMCAIIQVQKTEAPGKYLGMPMRIGMNKMEVFGFIIDKVQQKLQGWTHKDISEQERKMNRFMWGRGALGKGIKWMAWSKMCMPKGCGGLGVRELRRFNLSMLAKQCWRLLNQTNGFVTEIIKDMYYPNKSLLEAQVGKVHVISGGP
ncbi:uncharacterized protein LOC141660751 [Apium graveolens]|uniref:uncharacterized protein LOC141660751 n=1 Tax=Apium graveolens TaxID=4045 RepID=UPI003D7B1B2A